MTNKQRRYSPPPYAEVAEIVSEHPMRYAPEVAAKFGVAIRTAQKWVREGRMLGVIPNYVGHPCPTCGGTGVRVYGPGRREIAEVPE